MAKQQARYSQTESAHVGPGRPGKGKKILATTDPATSRRNGKKITFNVSAAEKDAIDSAKFELFSQTELGYAEFTLSLIEARRRSLSANNSPANVAETNERISEVAQSVSQLGADLGSIQDSVNSIRATLISVAKTSDTAMTRRQDALDEKLEQLLTAQAAMSAHFLGLFEIIKSTTEGMSALAMSIKGLQSHTPPQASRVFKPASHPVAPSSPSRTITELQHRPSGKP